MAKRRGELRTDSSGQYYRQIGWKRGVRGQPKFRLGADPKLAELAYLKLGLLWDVEVEQNRRQWEAFGGGFDVPEQQEQAYWSDEGLAIAEAIRKHQHTVRVGMPDHIEGAAAYAHYIEHLRQIYGNIIQVIPADTEAAETGRQQHQQFAEHRSRQARLNARIANIPIPAGLIGQTLYQAIGTYADTIEQTNKKEWGRVEAANARRLKDSTPDMDLSEFTYGAMEKIKHYWAARPEARLRGGRSAGRPISIDSVDAQLRVARRLVQWLDRSDQFDWELPRHGLDALKVNLARLRTPEEIAALRHGVQVFDIEKLATVYGHATDVERLLILLGLNVAATQAEVTSLRWDEVEGDTVKRIRQKSEVYGEFRLWPESIQALKWWKKMQVGKPALVMTTKRGNPYTRQRISNTWKQLKERIERATGEPAEWWLSFKYLRKTAAQMVRNVSDGEVAGVFLSHGQPVSTDELADKYSNRPFAKVAAALMEVCEQLSPMFDAAPDAFRSPGIGRGAKRPLPA